ncbi:hypothetical protein Vretimale_18085, partial [Volvox reticuliferus]
MPLFGQGRCAMAIAGPNQFKIDSIARRATPPSVTSPATNSSNSSNSSSNSSSSGGSGASPVAAAFSVKGRIGAAIFPGSSEVLDWTAKKMVPCDATRCPHAVQYPGGLYVNAPPFAAMVGFAAFINKKFTPVEQLVTYNLISQAVRPDNSWALVAEPSHGGGPTRTEHLKPSNRRKWQQYGYDAGDLDRFLTATTAALESQNIAMDIRSVGANNFTRITYRAAVMLGGEQKSPAQVLYETQNLYNVILNASNRAELLRSYRASIGYTLPPVSNS